jgi:tetratricopeptide (TPR) repeat protein
VVAALGSVHAAPVGAQLPIELPELRTLTATPLEQADSLFLASAPAAALTVLEAHLNEHPDDYEARWRASRAGLVLGILEPEEEVKEALFVRAGDHGEAAVEQRPQGVDGLYWAAASLGREALQHGPRTSTRLVQQVWDLTHRLLELEPEHPGGHNILGKLNQEVMSLSGFERFIGRLLFRIDPLKEATWEKAVRHHERAVASDPNVVLFRMDLGLTYAALERYAEARAQYEAALEIEPLFPVDSRFQDDVRSHLADLPGG